jgi:Fe-S-cluster-containing dehydrogenase component/DMSO reductase anchor subunit
MRKGFIFNHNKCVRCMACSAACILENGWTVHPRNIYSYNSEADPLIPVINLSLACNHCESAVCMKGCPVSAYSREPETGAVLLDDTKCIGCKYCQWNCPYDAPKYDPVSGIMAKCNFCYNGLIEGLEPACSSACPTGALSYGLLSEQYSSNSFSWFPDKSIIPAIEFTAKPVNAPLKIIPENNFSEEVIEPVKNHKNISPEFSLIIFSFLSTISVAEILAAFIKGEFPDKKIFLPVLLTTGLVSFFHLGRKLRSWRSVINIKSSPLSREITAFIVYSVISLLTVFFLIPGLLITSAIAGLFFMLMIDSVYFFADRSKKVIIHTGQTFISALLIGSFLSGSVLPFTFIALIKIALSVYNLSPMKLHGTNFSLRFTRIALLIVSGASMISHISYTDNLIVFLFLAGEFFDRIIFYIDFNPPDINRLIDEQQNIQKYEKKRG